MTIQVAVIGVGSMGRNHLRAYWEMSNQTDVELVGLADVDNEKANVLGKRFGVKSYNDYRKMLEELAPDAVTIAVPTKFHYGVAMEAISRGVHVLIEKPLSFSIEEGKKIIDSAQNNNVKLMVGHIERFNPAIIALKDKIGSGSIGKIYQVEMRRQGPFPTRINDVGVVKDLAVHDLDILRYITGQEILRLYAETRCILNSSREDLLVALLTLENGIVGDLNINWVTPTKIRELRVLGEKGMFIINYLTQDLSLYKNSETFDNEWESLKILRGVSEGEVTRFVISKKEPLRAELEAFVQSIKMDLTPPVTGEDGLMAIDLAEKLIYSAKNNQLVLIS